MTKSKGVAFSLSFSIFQDSSGTPYKLKKAFQLLLNKLRNGGANK